MKLFIIVLSVLSLLFISPAPASAVLQVEDADLTLGVASSSSPYEVNADAFGRLWVSDYGVGEIWSINPNGVVPGTWDYTRYILPVDQTVDGPNPTDARRVGDFFYWAEYETGDLGRSTPEGAYQKWSFPGISGFNGIAVDINGNLWATDVINSFLYRLDPDELPNGELCTFTLPEYTSSYYLVINGAYLYFSDDYDSRLMRLTITDADVDWQLDWWDIPVGSSPFGLAVDEQGKLWYADASFNNPLIAVLDPNLNTLKQFFLPKGDFPAMLMLQGGLVWYTEQDLGGGTISNSGIGILNPATAEYTSPDITYGDLTQNPSCHPVTAEPAVGDLEVFEGSYTWGATGYYFPVYTAGGWQIFQMPTSAYPWGIASMNGTVYVVDNGRQKLLKVGINDNPPLKYVYLPVILR